MSGEYPARASASKDRKPASWLLDSAFWGGVSIVAIWLAVLFVGVFGGNIDKVDSTFTGGGSSSVPVVVVVAIVALVATIAVAHRAFGPRRADKELRKAVEEERQVIDRLSAKIDDLETKIQC